MIIVVQNKIKNRKFGRWNHNIYAWRVSILRNDVMTMWMSSVRNELWNKFSFNVVWYLPDFLVLLDFKGSIVTLVNDTRELKTTSVYRLVFQMLASRHYWEPYRGPSPRWQRTPSQHSIPTSALLISTTTVSWQVSVYPALPTFYEIKAEDLPPFGKKCGRFFGSENITIFHLPMTQNEPFLVRNNNTSTCR